MKKFFQISIVIGLTALVAIFCLGCDGVSGPRGSGGDGGDNGTDYDKAAPANRFFSLAIANNDQRSHNGAPKLYLSFDGLHQPAGDTVYSQRLAAGQIPAIDGIDGGTTEWGDKMTGVKLLRAAGNNNFIDSAWIRSAFDDEFVYFQVRWTEVANATFNLTKSRSDNPTPWIYPDTLQGDTLQIDYNLPRWVKGTTNEDRLNILFEISPVTRYESDGCYVTCHTGSLEGNSYNYHSTRAARERMDIWHWTAGSTNHTGYGFDRYLDHTSVGVKPDVGTPVVITNRQFELIDTTTYDRPLYQAIGQPGFSKSYPLWDFEITGVANSGWTPGTTIPAYVNAIPSLSAADLIAYGEFADGTWTVELKRKRSTGNGDDAQF